MVAGAIRARIDAASEVLAVLRVAAFPGGRVQLDGAGVSTRLVAPGFLGVSIPPGSHVLEAVVRPWPVHLAACATVVLDLWRLGRSRSLRT